MTVTVEDYNEAYYFRKPVGEPSFNANGPVRVLQARKAALFSSMIKGKRILDVGCGRGEQARWWAENGAKKVDGIDWSQDAVDIALSYCSHLKNVTIVKADARHYEHTHKHFYEVVLMLDFIEHLTKQDAVKVYKRCWKHWLTPDGWLGVVCPPKNVCKFHLYHQSVQTLRRDIESAGFRIKSLKKHKVGPSIFVVKAHRLRSK